MIDSERIFPFGFSIFCTKKGIKGVKNGFSDRVRSVKNFQKKIEKSAKKYLT